MPTPGEQKTIFDPQAVRLRGAAVHLSRSPPRGLRRAKETRVKPERLSREDLLLLKDGHCLRDHALAVCRLADRRLTESFEATSLPTLVQMVDNGLSTTLLPRLTVDAGLLLELVEYADLTGEDKWLIFNVLMHGDARIEEVPRLGLKVTLPPSRRH
jgi:DNA-binding transcriptional LysR family regulator